MSINLQKGQKISLSKESAGLSRVLIGLGWDSAVSGLTIDCDAFAMLLKNGKLADKGDIVYYANLNHRSYSVKHMGDNLTGAGDGDDEQILISLNLVPEEYDKIAIGVNIFKAVAKNQHFGQVKNAYIRLVDEKTKKEICIYNLTDNYSGSIAMLFGELYKHDGEWKFNAIGEGTKDGSIMDFSHRFE